MFILQMERMRKQCTWKWGAFDQGFYINSICVCISLALALSHSLSIVWLHELCSVTVGMPLILATAVWNCKRVFQEAKMKTTMDCLCGLRFQGIDKNSPTTNYVYPSFRYQTILPTCWTIIMPRKINFRMSFSSIRSFCFASAKFTWIFISFGI